MMIIWNLFLIFAIMELWLIQHYTIYEQFFLYNTWHFIKD